MNIPTEKLLGEGIDPSDLNDDVVGRTLDAIYKYGATELFNQIALHVMGKFSLGIATHPCRYHELQRIWQI